MPHLTGFATHPTPSRGPPLQTGPSSVPASNRDSPPSQTNQNVNNGLGTGYHFTQLSSTPEFKERLDRLFHLSPEAPTNGVNGYESAGASGGPNAVAVPPPSDEPSRSSVNSNLQATSNHSFSRLSAPSTALRPGYLPTNQNNADKYDFSYLTASSFPGQPPSQGPHGAQPSFPQFGYWQPQGASNLASSTQTMGQNYTLGGTIGLSLQAPPDADQTSQYSGSFNAHLRGQQRGFEDASFGPEPLSGQIFSASTSQRLSPSAEPAHNQGFHNPSLPTTSLTSSTLPSSTRADVPHPGFAFEYATPSAEDEVHTPNFADPSAQLNHPVVTGKVELVAQMSQRFNIPRHFVFPATERPPQGFKTWDEYQGRIKRLMRHPMYERLAEAFARGRWLDFLQEMSRCFPNEQGGMILRRVSFIAQGLGLPSDDFILGAARTFLRWIAPNEQAISTNPSFALMVQTVWMIIQPNQHLLWGKYRSMIVPYLNRSVSNPITSILVQTAEPCRVPRTRMVRTASYGSHATGLTFSRHSENQFAFGRPTRYAPY